MNTSDLLEKLHAAYRAYRFMHNKPPVFLILDRKTWSDILSSEESHMIKTKTCDSAQHNFYVLFGCQVAIIEKSTSGEFIQFS